MMGRMADGRFREDSGTERTSTGRLEAFSDGVFAIAITLLVLDLKVPPRLDSEQALAGALLDQWPGYVAFVASFAVIGIMWLNHHRMFQLIQRATHGVLLLNGLLLFMISAVPFPTALVSEYLGHDGARVAAVVYCGWLVLTSMTWNALWLYAASPRRRPPVLAVPADHAKVRGLTRSYLIGPGIYAAAALIAWFAPAVAVGLCGVNAVIYAISLVVDPAGAA
jgi:uncharacterized membrane protein